MDPALRHVVGDRASVKDNQAGSANEMERFETEMLSTKRNRVTTVTCRAEGSTRSTSESR
jgi:hypothetical protein